MALVKLLSFFAIFAMLLYRETDAISCVSKGDCHESEFCCNNVCRPSCVNYSCIFNSNCGDDSYCCNDICRLNCVGHSCYSDIDCGAPNEYCCYETCQEGTCYLAGWAIALIVIAVCIVLVIFGVALCVFAFRRRRPDVIVTVPAVVPGSNVNYGALYSQPNVSTPHYTYYHQQPTQQEK